MEQFAGAYCKSIHDLKCPDHVSSISLWQDGRKISNFSVPQINNFSKGGQLFQYLEFFMTTQTYYKNQAVNLTFDQFKNSCYVLMNDISAAGVAVDGHLPLLRMGDLSIVIEFEALTTQVTNILIYGQFPSMIEISKEKAISVSKLK